MNNSLIRSYLGKAYYEEKREKLFGDPVRTSPSSSTPWTRRPGSTTPSSSRASTAPSRPWQDMQKSIELNDNRAVYRSKLLLDQDLAARSASQARIYNDLGFSSPRPGRRLEIGQQRPDELLRPPAPGRPLLPPSPGTRSPGSAKLLQSQLLQPININPVQPQLR